MKTIAPLAFLLSIGLVAGEQCVLWNIGTRKVNYPASSACSAAACFAAGGNNFNRGVGVCCDLRQAPRTAEFKNTCESCKYDGAKNPHLADCVP